ncbi:MAG: hypothetical protein IJ213_03675 [Bacteroidales bacterium]|nr:hypothetical protein [Bacteroidales bacterium]
MIKRLQQLPTSDNTVNNNKTKTLTDNDIEDLITNLNKKPSTQIHTNITVPTDEELDDYINKLKI